MNNFSNTHLTYSDLFENRLHNHKDINKKKKCSCLKYENNNHIIGNINNSFASNIEDLKTNNTNLSKLFTKNLDLKGSKSSNLIIKPPLNNSNLINLFTKENNTIDIPNKSLINKNGCNKNLSLCNFKKKCNTCYCNYPQYNLVKCESCIPKISNKDNLEYIFQIKKDFKNIKNYDNKLVNCNCDCDYILYDC